MKFLGERGDECWVSSRRTQMKNYELFRTTSATCPCLCVYKMNLSGIRPNEDAFYYFCLQKMVYEQGKSYKKQEY